MDPIKKQDCPQKVQEIIHRLLKWYTDNARTLPWRYDHNEVGNPYHTWLSEVMLQQTTVITVIDYFHRFIEKWPTLKDLANASEEEVLTNWQGLGYYSRARNLLKCARYVHNELGGSFPKDLSLLLTLPGVGPYTASAISSIAFQQNHVPVDGNIIRVMSRLYGLKTPLPGLKGEIENLVEIYETNPKPGNFAQGLMDFGATLCRPKKPSCDRCPLQNQCVAYGEDTQHLIPFRKPKPQKPTRFGRAFLIYDKKGLLLLQKRPEKGLLANMMEVPSTLWSTDRDEVERSFSDISAEGKFTRLEQRVKHTFTHFHLELDVYHGGVNDFKPRCATAKWVAPDALNAHPLPTLMKKVIQAGDFS